MQGRLVGKRVTGQFFVDHCREHGTHFCTYLLGTDMEMNTPKGFSSMTWESGYGDYLNRPDWSTLRVIPWLEKTALVLGDVVDEAAGELVSWPHDYPAPSDRTRRNAGTSAQDGLGTGVLSPARHVRRSRRHGLGRAAPLGLVQRGLPASQATKAEPIYRQFRNLMTQAGVPIEFSKGEAAPGQHEVNIHYDDALESADRAAIYKHGTRKSPTRTAAPSPLWPNQTKPGPAPPAMSM